MMVEESKPLVWLAGEIETPPFSAEARREAGYLLRRLQWGETISMPFSRPMSSIGPRCYELRIQDRDRTWRIIVRVDTDAVVLAEIFAKKTRTTPNTVVETCRKRLQAYDTVVEDRR
jgi:phage-related protein